jgi:hypothetical protein
MRPERGTFGAAVRAFSPRGSASGTASKAPSAPRLGLDSFSECLPKTSHLPAKLEGQIQEPTRFIQLQIA